jgi:hypothetical protein
MSLTITARPNVTTEEIAEVLRQGLGDGYTVLAGTGMNWNPVGAPRADKPDMIVVGKGSTRLFRAEVTISRSPDKAVLHVIAGGIGLPLRLLNRFWIADRARRCLQTASGLHEGVTVSGTAS